MNLRLALPTRCLEKGRNGQQTAWPFSTFGQDDSQNSTWQELLKVLIGQANLRLILYLDALQAPFGGGTWELGDVEVEDRVNLSTWSRRRRNPEAALYGCHARRARNYAIATSTWHVLLGYESFGCEGETKTKKILGRPKKRFSDTFFSKKVVQTVHLTPLLHFRSTAPWPSHQLHQRQTWHTTMCTMEARTFKHFHAFPHILWFIPCFNHISARYQ